LKQTSSICPRPPSEIPNTVFSIFFLEASKIETNKHGAVYSFVREEILMKLCGEVTSFTERKNKLLLRLLGPEWDKK
jgi:hypothetical protein